MAPRIRLNKVPAGRLDDKKFVERIQRLVREAANEAIAHLGFEVYNYGGKIEGAASASLSFKIKAQAGADTDALVLEDFNRWAPHYRMKPGDFKRKFLNRGVMYELIGFNPSRPKFCVKGRDILTGRELLFSSSVLERLQ